MTDISTGTVKPNPESGIDPLLESGATAPAASALEAPRTPGSNARQRSATASAPDPLSPDFLDPNYDPDEWERLPRRTSPAFRIGLTLALVLLGGAFTYARATSWLADQIDPPGLQGDRVVFEVPQGATDSDVLRLLADAGVISNSTVAQYWIRYKDIGGFQAGEYEMRVNSSFEQAVSVLEAGPLPPVFQRLALPEGLWSGDMRNVMLDSLPLLDPAELDVAMNDGQVRSQFQPPTANSIEGLMFPATYEISEEESTNELAMVQRLVNTMDQVIVELGVDEGLILENGLTLTPYELVIVASMIEEEARIDEDRAKIARVIYNRLIAGEALGIDATTIYGVHVRECDRRPECANPSTDFGWYNPELLQSQLDDATDPYNTRLVVGLPPTPISSPGRASLEAALNPEPGPWRWYVLADTEGRHFFTDDFAEFERQRLESIAAGIF